MNFEGVIAGILLVGLTAILSSLWGIRDILKDIRSELRRQK